MIDKWLLQSSGSWSDHDRGVAVRILPSPPSHPNTLTSGPQKTRWRQDAKLKAHFGQQTSGWDQDGFTLNSDYNSDSHDNLDMNISVCTQNTSI